MRSDAPPPSEPPTAAVSFPKRLPFLDGWRAVSIVLVLGSHCKSADGFPPALHPWFTSLFDASFGVRTFFIISGFLITWLLLIEQHLSGRINLRNFYLRRSLRILPVYAAFLAVLAGLSLFSDYRQPVSAWFGNLTFTTNFIVGVPWTSGHLWSLAVEEQFYLLWPGLFVLCGGAANSRMLSWVLAVPLLLAPAWRIVSYLKAAPVSLSPLFSQCSFFNQFDSLAAGCGCALLYFHRRDSLRAWLTVHPAVVASLAIVLIIGPHALTQKMMLAIVTVPFGPTLQTLGMSLLLMQSLVMARGSFYDLLERPFLIRVGVLSYSLYIWQQLFCTNPAAFGWESAWWLSFPGWLVTAALCALLSFYCLERPFFRLRSRFGAHQPVPAR